jgi:hypothetical protein
LKKKNQVTYYPTQFNPKIIEFIQPIPVL